MRYGVKFAVTVRSPFSGTVSTHVMPVQSPLNPAKVDPAFGAGISVTVEPTGKMARQIPDLVPPVIWQARPPGELEMVPVPPPAPVFTVIDPGTASRYRACTERDAVSGT